MGLYLALARLDGAERVLAEQLEEGAGEPTPEAVASSHRDYRHLRAQPLHLDGAQGADAQLLADAGERHERHAHARLDQTLLGGEAVDARERGIRESGLGERPFEQAPVGQDLSALRGKAEPALALEPPKLANPPPLRTLEEMGTVVSALERPVNVVMGFADPSISLDQLAEVGVRRVSIGGALSRLALRGLLDGARQMREGRFEFVRDIVPLSELWPAFD